MKTFSPRPRDIERRWYVLDADGAVLGRLASQVATILRGKHKPIYAPHADAGDHVIVVNARGVRVTGGKEAKKIYYRHSGYPGGLRRIGYEGLLAERPAVAVEKAIGGMLPKTRLGRQMLNKLAVYDGPEHPHQAQKPVPLGLGQFPRWEGLPKPALAQPKESRLDGRTASSGPARRPRPESGEDRPSASRRVPARAKAATRRGTDASKGELAGRGRPAKAPAATTSRAKNASTGGSKAASSGGAKAATTKESKAAASPGGSRASTGESKAASERKKASKDATTKSEAPKAKRATRRAKKES
jgi:large subunit ribosomal protein L13